MSRGKIEELLVRKALHHHPSELLCYVVIVYNLEWQQCHLKWVSVVTVKGQGHKAALLIAAFKHQAAAAVTMGTYSPWEPTATLRSGAVGLAVRGASVPTEGGKGGDILWRLPHNF